MNTIIPRFAYGIVAEDGERFFEFAKFPEIISAVGPGDFEGMTADDVRSFAHDAVVSALVARMSTRQDMPQGDDDATVCDGFVDLDVVEAMKLALYDVYLRNFRTVAEFAARIGKSETAARRLLDFRHNSRPAEIEAAMEQLGKRLHHEWRLIAA